MNINEQMNVLKKYNKEWHIEQAKERAHNGFTHAPNIWQIISVCTYLLICSHYLVMVSFMVGWEKRLSFIVTEVFIAIFVLGSWFRVSTIDPADSTHAQHWKSILEQSQYKKPEHRLMCPICQTYCSAQSFHCKKCNKCIQKFDHHCKWINNCIGLKNYTQFLILLISLITFLTFNVGSIIYYLINTFSNQDRHHPFTIFTIIICVVHVVGVGMIGSLFVFHIVLICAGKRTISFIMQMRRSQKQELKIDKADTEKSEDPISKKLGMVLKPIGLYQVDRVEKEKSMEENKKNRKNLPVLKMAKISFIKAGDKQVNQLLKTNEVCKK